MAMVKFIVFATVITIFLIGMAHGSISPEAMPVVSRTTKSCANLKFYIDHYGRDIVIAWGQKQGYTLEHINRMFTFCKV